MQQLFLGYGRLIRNRRYFPLWLVPYRMPAPYRFLSDGHRARTAGDELYVDFAVYGLKNDRPGVNFSELLELKTYEMDGIKTLISENHYDETTFWTIYNREGHARVKQQTDPHNLFRGLYEKFHFQRGTTGATVLNSRKGGKRLSTLPLNAGIR